MTWDGEHRQDRRPSVEPGVVALSTGLALGLTLFLALVMLPAVAVVAAALSELVLFGVLLLLSSLVRIAAGLFGARMYRRRHGTDARTDALPSVLVAMAVAWGGYALLVGGSSALTANDVQVARLLLELPRWLLEGAVGAALIGPGEPERLDPVLRRFATPRRGQW